MGDAGTLVTIVGLSSPAAARSAPAPAMLSKLAADFGVPESVVFRGAGRVYQDTASDSEMLESAATSGEVPRATAAERSRRCASTWELIPGGPQGRGP
jgi:hypothetical protein